MFDSLNYSKNKFDFHEIVANINQDRIKIIFIHLFRLEFYVFFFIVITL